ncbi:LamG-like jellyroll fold domain-containing protein, partial [Streptomyces sp. NPDC055134]
MPAAAADPGDSLVLHYDFEDSAASETTVKDLSARHLDGRIIHPDKATYTQGRISGSQAISLPGGAATSDTAPYVDIPNGLFKDASALTISTWTKWDGGADFQWLYNLGKDAGRATFFTPSFADDHKLRASIKPTTGNAEIGVSGSTALPADKWVNVTTVVDGKTLTTYLNGISIGTKAAAIDLASTMYGENNDTSGFLGKAFWGGHPFYAGEIDDFRVYNTALDRTAVRAVVGDGVPTFTKLDKTQLDLDTVAGQPPVLPDTIDGTFSDGISRPLSVDWDTPDPSAYDTAGTVPVTGHVKDADNAEVKAVVTVAKAEIAVDLAQSTGAFMGGASGTLYGVYGPQVPSSNRVDGMNLRTVATEAQDGPQHAGADAVDV